MLLNIVVVDLLFIVTPIFTGVLRLVFALFFNILCPSSFCNHLDGVEKAGCFTLTVFLISIKLKEISVLKFAITVSQIC